MAAINGLAARFFCTPGGDVLPLDKSTPARMRLDVFDRDGGVCGECGVQVRRFQRGRGDPLAGEVDHIIPRSRGGRTTPENLRLLCSICNRRKSNS